MELSALEVAHLGQRRVADNLLDAALSSALGIGTAYAQRDTGRAVSQENIERVQSWIYRWNAGDRETFDDEIRPDAEIVTRILGGTQHGPEGVRRWFREIEEQFDEWIVSADEWYDAGDLVAAIAQVRLRGRGSGVAFETPVGMLFEIRGGKLSRLQTFVEDPRSALEAVGVRE